MSLTAVIVTLAGRTDDPSMDMTDPANFGGAVLHAQFDTVGEAAEWMLGVATEMDTINEITQGERMVLPIVAGIEEDPDPFMLPTLEAFVSTPNGQAVLMLSNVRHGGAPVTPDEFLHFALDIMRGEG